MAHLSLRRPLWIALGAVLVLAPACSPQSGVQPESPDPADPSPELRVANRNSSDATIYMLIRGSGTAHRIGSVTAFREARLAIPRAYARQDIQFRIRLFGSGDEYTTEEIYAGDVGYFVLTVGPELRLTTLVER